jgi:hypothetical protein
VDQFEFVPEKNGSIRICFEGCGFTACRKPLIRAVFGKGTASAVPQELRFYTALAAEQR